MTVRVFLLAMLLMVCSLSLISYKVYHLGIPFVPGTESDVWTLEVELDLQDARHGSEVQLILPVATPGFEILNEAFLSSGFSLAMLNDRQNRRLIWNNNTAETEAELVYKTTVRRDNLSENFPAKDSDTLEEITISSKRIAVVRDYLRQNPRVSADNRIFAKRILELLNQPQDDELAQEIFSWRKTPSGKLFLASQILSIANVPSRVVHGLRLDKPRRKTTLRNWLEVFDGQSWVRFNYDGRRLRWLKSAFAWWHGRADLVSVKRATLEQLHFSVNVDEFYLMSKERARLASHFGKHWALPLLHLSTDMQALFRIMLLVPLGALIICVIRNIIGIQTFGTFMPVLVALAFRDTQLFLGVLLFTIAVSVGLIARYFLSWFRLLMVPRLASMLSVVVLLLLCAAILMSHFDIEQGLSIALFPLVIMTMTIERMSILWEELGPLSAIKRGLGTLLSAVIVYVCIFPASVQYSFFIFPELILLILSLTILIGRYTGYRFSELMRFRELGSSSL